MKTKLPPEPRRGRYMCAPIYNSTFAKDTWLEGEEFCYPSGGMHRRARALCEDGKLRVFRCGIPDTMFSIPARAGKLKGFLSVKGDCKEEAYLAFTEVKEAS